MRILCVSKRSVSFKFSLMSFPLFSVVIFSQLKKTSICKKRFRCLPKWLIIIYLIFSSHLWNKLKIEDYVRRSDHYMFNRSSHRKCSMKKGVLKNFVKLTGKHLCQSLFFNDIAGLSLQFYLKRDSDTGISLLFRHYIMLWKEARLLVHI